MHVVPPTARKALIDLEHDECRYLYGDGPFRACADKAVPGLPYCRTHAEVCYAPPVLRLRLHDAIEKIAKQMEPV